MPLLGPLKLIRSFIEIRLWQKNKEGRKEQQQQQQQQQQHFISPHNIQEIKIYNNSTDNDRGAGCPK